MGEGKRLLHSIQVRNLLSFGPESAPLELAPLNVLIGPNGAGKSNLIDALSILQAAPWNLTAPFTGKAAGGVREWFWAGAENPEGGIKLTLADLSGSNDRLLKHELELKVQGQGLSLGDESIATIRWEDGFEEGEERFLYRYDGGGQHFLVVIDNDSEGPSRLRTLSGWSLPHDQSILSQIKDPFQYPELTYLGRQYEAMRLYREWNLGRNTPPRHPYPADLPGGQLREDAGNLVLVLNELERHPAIRRTLLERLREFNGAYSRLYPKVEMGSVQLYLEETLAEGGGESVLIPATRLSDGTMRFLCLLAVLCHPQPPPVTCIEEPEMGLHPDILPTVAEMLLEASRRTQLIVTTHSDLLVDALTETPEAVVVCDKGPGGTRMRRLEKPELSQWLGEYRLGGAWLDGRLGGTRW